MDSAHSDLNVTMPENTPAVPKAGFADIKLDSLEALLSTTVSDFIADGRGIHAASRGNSILLSQPDHCVPPQEFR